MWVTLTEHQHSCQTALLSFLICTNLVFSDLPSLSWFILNLGLHSKDLQFPGHSQNNFESSVFLIFKIVYSFEKCQYQECIKNLGAFPKVTLNLLCVLSSPLIMLIGKHSDFSGKSQKFVWANFFLFLPLRLKKKKSIMKTWSKCTSIWMDKWFRMKPLFLKEYLAHMICLVHDLK